MLVYCFWLVLTTGAFWIVRMEHVLELFEGVYQTGRWPIGVYPGWLRYSVTFLVPVGVRGHRAGARRSPRGSSGRRWSLAFVFAAVLFGFTRWFWRFGLRHYSGASA